MEAIKRKPYYNKETVKSPAEQGINGSGTKTGIIINRSFVTVRNEPSETSRIKEYVQRGSKVEILESTNGYYKIEYGSLFKRTGYISMGYCREV